jgi:hypothetical protein
MKFNEWLEKRMHEGLRSKQTRDPFARQTLLRKPVDAGGKTCDWCGSESVGGKLYQYKLESDGGRSSEVKGLFCCDGCMKSYHEG